jgi:hypothetical protein
VSDTVWLAGATPVPVPVIVSVRVPRVAVFATVTVNVELVPVTDAGLNDPVTPVPWPLSDNATAPVNPPVRVIVTPYVVFRPRLTDRDVGDTDSENAGWAAAVTTNVMLELCVSVPLVPVTVTA